MPKSEPAEDRFWRKVAKTSECWEWLAHRSYDGYGRFWTGERNVGAHRWAYEAEVGPIPSGLMLDHLCRNRGCVNPAHLEPVTNLENAHRGEPGVHMREKAALRETCAHGHAWSPENTRHIDGYRRCRECSRLQKAERDDCPTCGKKLLKSWLSQHMVRVHSLADPERDEEGGR